MRGLILSWIILCLTFSCASSVIAQTDEKNATETGETKQDAAKDDNAATGGDSKQEEKTEAKPEDKVVAPDDDSLEGLLAQWKELDTDLRAKEFAALSPNAEERSRIAYTDVVEKANALIEKIKVAAFEALKKDPSSELASKTLVGIMMNLAMDVDTELAIFEMAETAIADGMDMKYIVTAATAERIPLDKQIVFEEIAIRAREAKSDLPRVNITTSKGDIVVELFENEAPNTVANFVSLAEDKFYDGRPFHRVLKGFMAQTGCPKGDGTGGPGYEIKCESYRDDARSHFPGYLSMAHSGRDTGGSQFFMIFNRSQSSHLDRMHTVFGRIVSGHEVLDTITLIDPNIPNSEITPDTIVSMEVVRKRDHEYKPVKVGDEPEEAKPEAPTGQPPKAGEGGAAKTDEDKKEEPKSEGG